MTCPIAGSVVNEIKERQVCLTNTESLHSSRVIDLLESDLARLPLSILRTTFNDGGGGTSRTKSLLEAELFLFCSQV